jgi:hypothetical protein
MCYSVGRDSVVGIATCYELNGLGIESRWGRDFQHASRLTLGPTKPPVQWVPGHSRGIKRLGHGINHPPPSSAKVKERVELYLYSPSGPSWPVVGWTLLYFYVLFSRHTMCPYHFSILFSILSKIVCVTRIFVWLLHFLLSVGIPMYICLCLIGVPKQARRLPASNGSCTSVWRRVGLYSTKPAATFVWSECEHN